MFDDARAIAAFVVLLLVAFGAGVLVIVAGWADPPECPRCGCPDAGRIDGFHGQRWKCPGCGHSW